MQTNFSKHVAQGWGRALDKHKLVDGHWVPTVGEEGGKPSDGEDKQAKALRANAESVMGTHGQKMESLYRKLGQAGITPTEAQQAEDQIRRSTNALVDAAEALGRLSAPAQEHLSSAETARGHAADAGGVGTAGDDGTRVAQLADAAKAMMNFSIQVSRELKGEKPSGGGEKPKGMGGESIGEAGVKALTDRLTAITGKTTGKEANEAVHEVQARLDEERMRTERSSGKENDALRSAYKLLGAASSAVAGVYDRDGIGDAVASKIHAAAAAAEGAGVGASKLKDANDLRDDADSIGNALDASMTESEGKDTVRMDFNDVSVWLFGGSKDQPEPEASGDVPKSMKRQLEPKLKAAGYVSRVRYS